MASRREFRWAFVFIITLFVLGSELSAFVDSSSRPSPLKDNGSLGDYSKTLAEQFAEDPQLVVRVPGDGKDLTQLEAVFRKLLFPENRSGIEVLRDIRILRQLSDEHTIVVFRLNFADSATLWKRASQAMLELTRKELVVWIEPVFRDYFLSTTTANDPFFNSTGAWGQSYLDLWGLHTIGAPDAWDTTTGAEDLIIAVVDSGIEYTHPDLHSNIWVNPAEVSDVNTDGKIDTADIDTDGDGLMSAMEIAAVENGIDDGLGGRAPNGLIDDLFGYDFIDGDNDPRDFFGHGTHIAGTIGAAGNNGVGITGINWRCKLLAANGFDALASATSLALAESLMYAADEGARVINCSWGSLSESQLIDDAIDYAADAGAIVVFASGNFAIDSLSVWPKNHRSLTINASNQLDEFTLFSNFGIRTDCAAPGGGSTDDPLTARNVLSTLAQFSFFSSSAFSPYHVAPGYLRLAGTSMAAPHATGALGLILANDPTLSVEEARQVLRASASDQGAPGWDPLFGYGRIDVAGALTVSQPSECRISAPDSGTRRDQVSNPAAVSIEGTARNLADPATTYRLDYREENDPTWNSIVPWTMAAVTNGLLGTWDTTALALGRFIVRLQVEDSFGQIFEDRIQFLVPRPPMPGWPLTFQNSGNNFGSPRVADLDGDGLSEIVAIYPSTLEVLDAAGQPKSGFPITSSSLGGNSLYGTPAIADFDPTYPGLETVIIHRLSGSLYEVNVFHADGTRRLDQNWPVQIAGDSGGDFMLTPILADFDFDGTPELIATVPNTMRILDQFGNDLTPPSLAAEDTSGSDTGAVMAVGDVSGDGLPDIVFGRRYSAIDDHIIAYDFAGNQVLDVDITNLLTPHVAVTPDRFSLQGLCLVNLDGDAALEVAAVITNEVTSGNGYSFRDHEIIAVNGDGTLVTGSWPAHVDPIGFTQLFPGILSYILAGDLDADGQNEVIAATLNSVTVLRSDGSDFGANFVGVEFESPPIAGDLDGDVTTQELIASGLFGSVYGFDLSGGQVDGFPLGIHGDSIFLTAAPALGDIDGDGLFELVVKEPSLGFPSPVSHLVAYDVDGLPGAVWPQFHNTPDGRNAVSSCIPPHDDCDNSLTLGLGSTVGTFNCATNDGDASCALTTTSADVWYTFTAPCAGVLTVDSCGTHDTGGTDTGSDLVLSLHSDCPGSIANEIACNDDWTMGTASSVCSGTDLGFPGDAALTLVMTDAQEVLIRVSHPDGAVASTFVLNVEFDCDCNDITDLACDAVGLDIALTWTNQDPYSAITVYRDGITIATLGSGIESYLDVAPPPGEHSYSLQGDCSGPLTHFTTEIFCTTGLEFRRGDCNGDGEVDIGDAITLLSFLFPNGPIPTIDCDDACDGNDDGSLDIGDAIRVLAALFGTPTSPLSAPYPDCGVDPTNGALECEQYSLCP